MCSERLGGARAVFRTSYEAGRVELFNMDPDPRQRHTVGLPCHHVMSYVMSCHVMSCKDATNEF